MFCKNCGKKLDDEAKFCKSCGKPVVLKEKDASSNKEEISKYKGLRGWLILVIIGLFATVLWQAYGVYESITLFTDGTVDVLSNPASGAYIPGFVRALKFEFITEILFLIFAVYFIFLFFKKSRKFPKYYVFLLVASVVYVVLDYIILSSLTVSSSEMKQVIDEVLSEGETEIGRTVITAIIWGLYMTKSKRVKVTFVEE